MKRNILALLAFSLPFFSDGQIIKTYAGNGTAVSSGDGGPATAAGINGPGGVAIDTLGNIYVSEYNGQRIRKISPSGTISAFAGTGVAGSGGDGGPASAAQFYNPSKMLMDRHGNIYVVDRYNRKVRKISASGIVTTIAGNGSTGYSGDGGPATAAEFADPTGIALDASGNLYIADCFNYRVRVVSPSGTISTFAGTGTPGAGGDGGPASAAQLNQPFALVIDGLGNLYIADLINDKVRKVTPTGIISTVAGLGSPGFSGDGGMATNALLSNPAGLAVDTANNIYVADQYNQRIRRISTAGFISTVAGNGTAGYSGDGSAATAAELNYSNEMAFNLTGNLLIIDNNNQRVRILGDCMSVSLLVSPVPDTVPAGVDARFFVVSGTSGVSYQWQEDPGTGFVNIPNIWPYSGTTTDTLTIHNASIPLSTTHYRCVITNETYCVDTSSSAILIVRATEDIGTAAADIVNIYPNPASDHLFVHLSAKATADDHIYLISELGQTVLEKHITSNSTDLDISHLSAGFYICRVKANGTYVNKKLTKN